MATATIALVVSCVSVGLTLGGLCWQLALYRLSGSRLRVQLVFVFRDDVRRLLSMSGSKRMTWADCAPTIGHPEFFGIECVRVRVTNVGRTPVSVDSVALDTGRARRLRRGRKTIVPWAFTDVDSSDPELKEPSSGSIRLEAGASASRYFHLWPAVTQEIERGGGQLVIRGSATAAGRRDTLSPRRAAWKFKAGDETWYLDHKVTPELRAYRVFWQHSYDEMVGGLPLLMKHELFQKLRDGESHDELVARLDELSARDAKPRFYGMVAREAHQAFHAGDETSGDPGSCTAESALAADSEDQNPASGSDAN